MRSASVARDVLANFLRLSTSISLVNFIFVFFKLDFRLKTPKQVNNIHSAQKYQNIVTLENERGALSSW
ncbi:hypothetical protein HDF11_000944 [Tunturiibacter psychrotolerans]